MNFLELKKMNKLLKQFHDFLDSKENRQWLTNKKMQVYVRKSKRLVENQLLPALDIATIEVQPKYQRQGLCSNFINYAHQNNPFTVTYIENSLNPILTDWLKRNKWIEISYPPHCFYKISTLQS